jgi:putative transposase
LRDEGEPSGINRIYRLYREEGLTVRKARNSSQGGRKPAPDPLRGQAECLPLVARLHDKLACGRRFRILTIADDCHPEVSGGHPRDLNLEAEGGA